MPVRQAVGEGTLCLAAVDRRRHGPHARPVRVADRGDGLAPNGGAATAATAGADVNNPRFAVIYAWDEEAILLGKAMPSDVFDLPQNPDMQARLTASEQALEAERAAHRVTR